MAIQIYIDPADIDTAMRRMEGIPWALQRAVYPAVAEVVDGVKEQVAAHLEKEVPLPAQYIKRAIRITIPHAAGNMVIGDVTVKSSSIPLMEYDVQPPEITARQGVSSKQWPGFTYSLQAGERRQSSERIKGAGLPFIARMPGGHVGVYYRADFESGLKRRSGLWGTGKHGANPHAAIKQDYAPSVQYHISIPSLLQNIADDASDAFPIVLARYVDQAIAAHGGKS